MASPAVAFAAATPPHSQSSAKTRISTPHPHKAAPVMPGRVSFSHAPTPLVKTGSSGAAAMGSAALKARQATPFSKTKENVSFALNAKAATPLVKSVNPNWAAKSRQATPYSHPKDRVSFHVPEAASTPRVKSTQVLTLQRKSTPFVRSMPSTINELDENAQPRLDSAYRLKAFQQKLAQTPREPKEPALPSSVRRFIEQRAQARSASKPELLSQRREHLIRTLSTLRPGVNFASWSNAELEQRLQAFGLESKRFVLEQKLREFGLSPGTFADWDNAKLEGWIALESSERMRAQPLRLPVFQGRHVEFPASPAQALLEATATVAAAAAAVVLVEEAQEEPAAESAKPPVIAAIATADAETVVEAVVLAAPQIVPTVESVAVAVVEENTTPAPFAKAESKEATNWASMTCVQLKAELKKRGLKTSGLKIELVQRLLESA